MPQSMTEALFVFVLRVAQAALAMLPTLLVGLLLAGVIRAHGKTGRVRNWLDRGRFSDLIRAMLLSLAIPVCALGVLPILHELYRQRVRPALVAVVGLTAGVFNIWSFVWFVEKLGPAVAGVFVLALCLFAVAGGGLAFLLFPSAAITDSHEPASPVGLREVLRHAAATFWSRGLWIDLAVALLGIGLTATLVPPGGIAHFLLEREWDHAALLMVIPVGSYSNPESIAMQSWAALENGCLPGLVAPILIFGAGVTFGHLSFAIRTWGVPRTLCFALILLLLMAAMAGGVDRILYDGRVPLEDSHALDAWGRPWKLIHEPGGPLKGIAATLRATTTSGQLIALAAIATLLIAGPRIGRSTTDSSSPGSSRTSRALPRRVVVGAFTAVFITCGVAAAYTYFPPPAVALAELREADGNLFSAAQAGDCDAAIKAIDQLNRLSGKANISLLIRPTTSPDLQNRFAEYRQAVSNTQSELSNGKLAGADLTSRSVELSRLLRRCARTAN